MDAASTELLRHTEVTCLPRRFHKEYEMENGILGLSRYDDKMNQMEYVAHILTLLND